MRNRRKMAPDRTSITGAPPPTIQRQLTDQSHGHHSDPHHSAPPAAPPSRAPTISGPIQSPKLPVDRCIEMNRPLLAGKRCASSPRAGGCHIAVPAEAIASAARISA